METTKAVNDVLNERQRQISEKSYTSEHDDKYGHFELARAGVSYAQNAVFFCDCDATNKYKGVPSILGWPFAEKHWKPKSVRKDLVKAAALIIAEIESIDRMAEGA